MPTISILHTMPERGRREAPGTRASGISATLRSHDRGTATPSFMPERTRYRAMHATSPKHKHCKAALAQHIPLLRLASPLPLLLPLLLLLFASTVKAQLPMEVHSDEKIGNHITDGDYVFDNPEHPFSNVTIDPPWCGYGYVDDKATLRVTFNTGQDHDLGALPFDAQYAFKVVALDQHHDPIFEQEYQLTLGEAKPEMVFEHDFGSLFNDISQLRVEPLTLDLDPGHIAPERLHAQYTFTIHRRIGTPPSGPAITSPQPVSAASNQVRFSWNWMGMFESACVHKFPRYQLQVLRLFERGQNGAVDHLVQAQVDWSQAAVFDLETGTEYVDLTVTEGTGFYAWRVRPITNWYSEEPQDPRNWGPWSSSGSAVQGATLTNITTSGTAVQGADMATTHASAGAHIFYYHQFNDDRNWIFSRTFTEGSATEDVPLRLSERITYATTLQQVQQEQTCLHEDGNTLASQTVLDLSGRPAIKSLPVPVEGQSSVGFVPHLMDPSGGGETNLSATDFDQVTQAHPYIDPPLEPTLYHHYFNYYSNDNTDTEVPDAHRFPYVHTTFHADGRVKETSAPGAEFALTEVPHTDAPTPENYHTPTTSYAGVTSTELTRVFGDQAYDPATVHQVITTDANGTTSTSYQDKEGHVLATSLVNTEVPNDLEPLPAAAGSDYTVSGSIGGESEAGPSALEAQATFTVDPPGNLVTFNYYINPATIHDACGNYCAACDATVELFLVEQDDPDATNLIDDDVHYHDAHQYRTHIIPGAHSDNNGEAPCSATPWTCTFSMALPAGTYILTRRITTNNQVGGVGYDDLHQSELEADYNAILTGQLGATLAALQSDPPDLAAAFATGTITYLAPVDAPADTVVSWPIGCGSLTMPVTRCPGCDDGSASFLDIFLAQYAEMADRVNHDGDEGNDVEEITTYNDAIVHFQLHGLTYTLTQFTNLIANLRNVLVGEDRRYSCEDLRNCWMSACIAYTTALESGATTIDLSTIDFSELPNGNSGVSGTAHVELMDIFLQCIGRHITRNATSTTDFLEHAYEATFYDPAATDANTTNCVSAANAVYTPDATSTTQWGDEVVLTTDNGTVTTTGWEVFDGCMSGTDGVSWTNGTPTTSEVEASLTTQLDVLRDACYEACFTKKDAFISAAAELLGQSVDDPNVLCAADALLAKCYSDCNGASVQYDQGVPTGIGPVSALSLMQNIIAGHFVLDQPLVNTTTCQEGFASVPVANIAVPPSDMFPSEPGFVEQLNTALDHLGPFMLQQDFTDHYGWHLLTDPVGGDRMEWTNPTSCTTLRVRIGLVDAASPPANDCPGNYNAGDFYAAANVRCGPLTAYDLHQVELFIGTTRVFGARFGDDFLTLHNISNALAGGQSFTSTYGTFVSTVNGIDFVRADNSAWPTTAAPLFTASGTPLLNVELLHGNTHAASVATTQDLEQLLTGDCQNKHNGSCSVGRGLCIQWLPGMGLDHDDADHIDLDPCATVIAANYLETIQQRMADAIAAAREHIRQEYHAHCADPAGIDDGLTFSYHRKQYQYTLYYYDRAGNLINTVAPAQVRTMEAARPDLATTPDVWRTTALDQHQRTTYVHNSLGQVVEQTTPNGGTTTIYLDLLGRPRIAQDAQQFVDKVFTYTRYDALGRVIETGQATLPGSHTSVEDWLGSSYADIAHMLSDHPEWPNTLLAYRTITTYTTIAPAGALDPGRDQRFLQNRVSYARTDEDGDLGTTGDQVTTYYSYDPHGNVEWLAQSIPGLGLSYVDYDYDLVSGRVREVRYNEGRSEQFFQRYVYDADGRIRRAETSTDGVLWDRDATYSYFKHGPLKRTLLGEDEVQGTDHTYTLQGWLKGINDPRLEGNDAGQDGMTGNVARDAFGMTLGYYKGDFTRTGSIFSAQEEVRGTGDGRELFNGNISGWGFTSQLGYGEEPADFSTDAPLAFAYTYDELNRLRTAEGMGSTAGHWDTPGNRWRSEQHYDPNGNIQNASRLDGSGTAVDAITYNMPTDPNGAVPDRLPSISEAIDGAGDDLKDGHTYTYYENGELKQDQATSGTVKVKCWDPYGKARHVLSGSSTHLRFLYDATGQRVAKAVLAHGSDTDPSFAQTLADGDHYTYYVRDAQGNILATYLRRIEYTTDPEDGNALDDFCTLSEEDIYGSARLGIRQGDGTRLHEVIWVNGTPTAPPAPNHFHPEVAHLQVGQLDVDNVTLYEHRTTPDDPHGMIGDDAMKPAAATANLYRAEDTEGNTLYTSRTVLDPDKGSSILYLLDGGNDPMYNSDGLFSDWHTGTISAQKPGKENKQYLFTIGEDGLPYLNTIDMDANSITLGEVMDPKNVGLDEGGSYTYTGAMAVFDDRTGDKPAIAYFKRFGKNGITQIVALDLLALSGGAKPKDCMQVLDAFTAYDQQYAYDELQVSPDGKYLAVADRVTSALWADHLISLYALSPEHNKLTILGKALVKATNISSLDFTGNSAYIYFVGSNDQGNHAYRIPVHDFQHATPQLMVEDAGDVRRTISQGILVTTDKEIKHVDDPEAATPTVSHVAYMDHWHPYVFFCPNVALQPVVLKSAAATTTFTRTLDSKRYELTDHLGNVRVVVSDRKLSDYDLENDLASDFRAEVMSRSDYYPFGSLLPGRYYPGNQEDVYRFAFNGKESDREVHNASGTSLDFGDRMYDPRVGRWLSLDPFAHKYADLSPYSAFADNPILVVDASGDTLVIAGSPEFQDQVLCKLQLLTNDRLELDAQGRVWVASACSENSECDLESGTSLLRELNESSFTTTIVEGEPSLLGSSGAKPNCLTAGGQVDALYAQNGVGDNATVKLDMTDDPLMWIEDPSTGIAAQERGTPFEVVVGHELVHALHIMRGEGEVFIMRPDGSITNFRQNVSSSYKTASGSVPESVGREEFQTTGLPGSSDCGPSENSIRGEQGIPKRAAYNAKP